MNMTHLYEGEPRDIFDDKAWESYRAEMAKEVERYPDRQEARDELKHAVKHLAWLAERDRIAA